MLLSYNVTSYCVSVNAKMLFYESLIEFTLLQVLIYSPTFFKYVHESWLDSHGRYPSTGFLSLLFAVHICDEVKKKLK